MKADSKLLLQMELNYDRQRLNAPSFIQPADKRELSHIIYQKHRYQSIASLQTTIQALEVKCIGKVIYCQEPPQEENQLPNVLSIRNYEYLSNAAKVAQ